VPRRKNAVRSTERKGYIARNVLRNNVMGRKNKKYIVYSTDPNFDFEFEDDLKQETLEPGEQKLYVSIDRKSRAGKEVTLIEGFIGTEEDLKELGKILKSKCGVGGTVKNGEVLIQGNFKEKIVTILTAMGYSVKTKGGN